MKKYAHYFIVLIFFIIPFFSYANVGPVVPGEGLWCITKRIGTTSDVIESKVCVIDSKIDVLDISGISSVDDLQASINETLEKVCDIQSKIDLIETDTFACNPTPISNPTIITVPGIYCLGANIAGQITIAVSDVELDLNGRKISGGTNGVAVNNGLNNIKIKNGTISDVTNNGIDVGTGCFNVTIKEVKTINCEVVGIKFDASSNSSVLNCDMSMNTTGLELDQSFKIVVDKCNASCNTQAGFSLISSTTNCFNNCKALSNGEGQTSEAQDVFGFVSSSGFGNVFEHCIANSTQALTTTDANSVAAGFAFLGTEMCSKIINSESANTKTDPTGLTIPYGIFLQAQFDTLETKTSANHGVTVNSVDWSPDGKFVAISGNTSGDVRIRVFEYDRTDDVLTQVATFFGAFDVMDSFLSIQWSPDGKFLAAGASSNNNNHDNLFVLEFNRLTNTLTQVAAVDIDDATPGSLTLVNSVDWSPDGKFLAIGIGDPILAISTNQLQVYEFDPINTTLMQVDVVTITSGETRAVQEVDWSPDGTFLAAGIGSTGGDVVGEVQVYSFNRTTKSLSFVTSVVLMGNDAVRSVNWSSDGKFLASGQDEGAGDEIRIYAFDQVTTLTQVATISSGGASVISVDWSPNGKFLATGQAAGAGEEIGVFDFNRNTNTLSLVDTATHGATVNSVNWSPDGGFLAIGGVVVNDPPPNSIRILSALEFPTKNVIKNNVVYCNKGNKCPAGVGISGSNIVNLIIGNTAYENVMNYQFVTNIFDSSSGFLPNPFQNLDAKPPLCNPINLACKICSIENKACDMQSKIDAILAAV